MTINRLKRNSDSHFQLPVNIQWCINTPEIILSRCEFHIPNEKLLKIDWFQLTEFVTVINCSWFFDSDIIVAREKFKKVVFLSTVAFEGDSLHNQG